MLYLHSPIGVVVLLTGVGIKKKTLEAMARSGVPVVGSDRRGEGLAADSASVPLKVLRSNEPTEYVYGISR